MNLEIGGKIKQLRLAHGLTQEQLGSPLNLSGQAVSKWESGATMPDIQLLPQLSALLGVTIDELFSITDDTRMDRIEAMLEDVRFLPAGEFDHGERFLREKLEQPGEKARATLLLAQLYAKRAREYNDLASPLARQALLLNPDEKSAHNAIFDANRCAYPDWNCDNHWELIAFYQEFLRQHPENPRTYLWLLDLLIYDGRTTEARDVLAAMDRVEHTYRTDLYDGLIAKAECDLPRAMACWNRMLEAHSEEWLVWCAWADCMARLCRYDAAMEGYAKALALQPKPRYTDMSEAMAQIAEIRGDIPTAIAMREQCMAICREDWGITDGEVLDVHRRELQRLRERKARNEA